MAQAISCGAHAPVLTVVNGVPTTTSLDVARHFGKRHDNVCRAIASLVAQLPADHALNFEEMVVEVDIGSGATRSDPAYRLTHKGFTLLAMGFTGARALEFKLAYIDAFELMEAELARRAQALAAPAAAAPLPRPPIRSRKDLSFTRLDAESRLTNWVVEPRERLWGDGLVRGVAFFQEIVELASHDECEAYNAVRFAFIGGWPSVPGSATQWNNRGPGEECGFAEAVARAVIDGLYARRAGAECFDPENKAQVRRRRQEGGKRRTVVKVR